MKSAENPKHRWPLVIGAAAILLTATGGYLKGSADGSEDARTRKLSGDPLTEVDDAGEKPKSSAASLEKTRQRLWTIWRNSPDPSSDWLLKDLSSSELGELMSSISKGAQFGADWQFRRLILDVWILKDGPAAMTFLADDKGVRPDINRIHTTQLAMAWGEDQPDAAFAWMNGPDLPPALKEMASNLRLNALMTLMDTNPDRAFEELSRMNPKDVSGQLLTWAGTHGKDPAVREKLLEHAAASGDPADLQNVQSTLLKVLSQSDPEAAAELRAKLKAAGSNPEELDVAMTVGSAAKAPEEAFGGWLENHDVSKGIPQEITFAIGAWMWRDADKAITWLHEQPPGDKRDALYLDTIPALAGFDRFDKAAEIAAAIESSELRAAAFRELDLRWSLVNKGDADRWKQELSAQNRELIDK
ncbi:MAG: hypothetical protein EOP88_13150 [Verrucomicrobiaceae bacterium]|nr:MAG: hypothetical protein EOP88_13150 [Verrucomicrobiaceae bacterium]